MGAAEKPFGADKGIETPSSSQPGGARKFDGVPEELSKYWGVHESQYGGLRSNFGALIQALNGGGRATNEMHDHYAEVLDGGTSETRGTWRKLKAMADAGLTRELTILFRLYGDVRRLPIHTLIDKDNGILADMTEAAEQCREDLAAKRGEEAEVLVRQHTLRVVRKSEETFWERAPELQAAEEEIARMRSKLVEACVGVDEEQNAEKRAAFRRRRDKLRVRIAAADAKAETLRDAMWSAMEGADGDELRPVYGAFSYADKTTSTMEALEQRIMHPGKDKEARDALVQLVREQCKELEQHARRAYVEARPK